MISEGSDFSATLTTSFMNMTLGNANLALFNPPQCEMDNETVKLNTVKVG